MKRKRRPSVCILRQFAYPDGGHVRRNAESLVDAGFDVTVVALRRPGQAFRETINGVQVYRLPPEHRRAGVMRYAFEYVSFFVLAFLILSVLHFRRPFRVIEVANMPDALVFAALIPRLLGARVVLSIFDNMPELLVVARGMSPRHPLVRLLAWLETASGTFANHVIVTQEMARRVVHQRGVPEERLTVVLNGPDDTLFVRPDPTAIQKDDNVFEVVTHGTILERFGIQILLDALPKIIQEIPSVRVHVIGEGEYKAKLEAQARQLGIADRVEFRGWVQREEIPMLVSRADVGYAGMLCDLMLSNKLMEFVALGIPGVVARWSTYLCYFDDDAVTYFDPGSPDDLANAILSVARDPARTAAKVARSSALFEAYRWQAQRQIYVGVFASLVRNGVAPATRAAELTPAARN